LSFFVFSIVTIVFALDVEKLVSLDAAFLDARFALSAFPRRLRQDNRPKRRRRRSVRKVARKLSTAPEKAKKGSARIAFRRDGARSV